MTDEPFYAPDRKVPPQQPRVGEPLWTVQRDGHRLVCELVAHKKRRQGQRSTTDIRPGEKASDYQQLTIRLPEDVRDELEALSQELHLPQWRVVVDAIQAYRASHQQAKVGRREDVR